MAGQSLEAGDLLISLPEHLLVTKKNFHSLTQKRYNLPTTEILTLFLAIEKHKEVKSNWYPYIVILPTEYTTCVYWNNSHLDNLPPNVKSKAQELIEESKSIFSKLTLLINNDPDLNYLESHWNWDIFKWAWSSVNTRCVYLGCENKLCNDITCETGHCALAPYIDLLDHSPNVTVQARINRTNSCYEILSMNPVKKYQQVFINYGNHDNRRLLLEYGFTCVNNPNDLIYVDKDEIYSIFKSLKGNIKLWALYQETSLLKSLGFTEDGCTWTLKKVLQILSLKSKERTLINQVLSDQHTLSNQEEECFQRILKNLVEMKTKDYKQNHISAEDVDSAMQMIIALTNRELELLNNVKKSLPPS